MKEAIDKRKEFSNNPTWKNYKDAWVKLIWCADLIRQSHIFKSMVFTQRATHSDFCNTALKEDVSPHSAVLLPYPYFDSLYSAEGYVLESITGRYILKSWNSSVFKQCDLMIKAIDASKVAKKWKKVATNIIATFLTGEVQLPSQLGALATSLVIDRSGSMKGEKLKKAKQAAESYIDDMKRGDCGAVIAFSTIAETLKEIKCIGARDDEKDDLKKAIGKISATNRTNIADGWPRVRIN